MAFGLGAAGNVGAGFHGFVGQFWDWSGREDSTIKQAKYYPKFVISVTPLVSRSDADGISHLHLRRFLMEGIGI